MKHLHVWVVGPLLLMLIMSIVAPVFAQDTEVSNLQNSNPFLGGCGVGEIMITEIDYDEPGQTDKYEFVELHGEPYSDLSQYELRFVAEDVPPITSLSLEGLNLGGSGYFIFSSNNLNVYDEPGQLVIPQENFIANGAGGVGLFDLAENEFCSFINYETTIAGYEDWVIIGTDRSSDGLGRGCRRSLAGWWSCNRITTPGGTNTVVAVTIGDLVTEAPSSRASMATFATMGLGLAAVFVWTRRK